MKANGQLVQAIHIQNFAVSRCANQLLVYIYLLSVLKIQQAANKEKETQISASVGI